MNEILKYVTLINRTIIAIGVGLVVCSLFGCKSVSSSVDKESVQVVTVRDTLLHTIERTRIDSLVRRDSVFIVMKGDTVWHESWHETIRLVGDAVHDTVYVSRDSSDVATTETITKTKTKTRTGYWWSTLSVVVGLLVLVGAAWYTIRISEANRKT